MADDIQERRAFLDEFAKTAPAEQGALAKRVFEDLEPEFLRGLPLPRLKKYEDLPCSCPDLLLVATHLLLRNQRLARRQGRLVQELGRSAHGQRKQRARAVLQGTAPPRAGRLSPQEVAVANMAPRGYTFPVAPRGYTFPMIEAAVSSDSENALPDKVEAFLCRSCEQTSQVTRTRCPCCGSFFSFRRAAVRVRDLEEDEHFQPYRRGRGEYRQSGGIVTDPSAVGTAGTYDGNPFVSARTDDSGDDEDEEDEEEDEDEDDEESEEEEDEEGEDEPTLLFEGKAEHVSQDSTCDEGFDHVLDGGLPHGAVVAVVGQPGAGKSTLLRVVSAAMAHGGKRVLLACPEESKNQLLKARDKLQLQKRFPKAKGRLFVVTTKDVDRLLTMIDELKVDLFILDSVDYAVSEDITKNAKVEITKLLCERAHCNARFADAERPVGMFLVHHTTKKGKLMGSNAIVHAVDACIRFDHIDPDTLLLADNQDEGTGYVRMSIYKKIRWASNLSKAYYRVTKSGLVHYDAEAEKESRARRVPSSRRRVQRERAVPKKAKKPTGRGGAGRVARSR